MNPRQAENAVILRRQAFVDRFYPQVIKEIDRLQAEAMSFPLKVTFASLREKLSIPPNESGFFDYLLYQKIAPYYDHQDWLVVREGAGRDEETAFVFKLNPKFTLTQGAGGKWMLV